MSRLRSCVFACAVAGVLAAASDQTAPTTTGDCPGQDHTKFTIRSARVSDPFFFLRWRALDEDTKKAVQALVGKPYSFATVNVVSKLIEQKTWLPDTPDARAEFDFSDIVVENCRDGKLDVVFHIFSATIPSSFTTLIEWRTQQVTSPSQAAGVAKVASPMQVAPQAGFDSARRFAAGGTARFTLAPNSVFRSMQVAGMGSNKSRTLQASLEGAYDSPVAWIRHAQWLVHYNNAVDPAAVNRQLGGATLAAQFSAVSKTFGGVALRFGGSLNGGTYQSAFKTPELAPDILSNTHFTSARLYAGATGNWSKQAFAVSYGFESGSTGNSFHGGWRKQVGDVRHQLWLPFGNHRLFEADQRLTAGGLQMLGPTPVAERFFGGNHETPFIAGDEWSVRANPVTRSIPANRLYLTSAGAGGDRFVSYNSTTALTVFRMPVVPAALLDDPQYLKLLNGAINSQEEILENHFATRDPHFAASRAKLPDASAKLDQIRAASGLTDGCTDALDSATTGVKHARDDKPDQAYGWMIELLPGGDNSLDAVVSACRTPATAPAIDALDAISRAIAAEFNAIDNAAAAAKAEADLAYVRRALDIVNKQLNVTAVSPVFVFDFARLGPNRTGPYSGTRYGIGGGVRLTLVGTVSFTVGYAVNYHPRPGEGKGAFFFSLTTRNVFE